MALGLMYDSNITVTATDVEYGATHRITRLERVIGYVAALADYYGNHDVLDKVASLHDHKGELTVTWKKIPTSGEQQFFLKAWKSKIGDGADHNVVQVVP